MECEQPSICALMFWATFRYIEVGTIMIKTNEQAERKYCPQAMHKDAKDVFCIGDNCMAWRNDEESKSRAGYCGLAGRPSAIMLYEMRRAAVITQEIMAGEK